METRIPLGTMVLGEKIGEGGYGVVHRAKVEPFNHDLAVKILNPHPFQSGDSRARERFIREAQVLMSLRHPYVTPIYGVGEWNEKPYILMEYFSGYDLHRAREKVAEPKPQKVLSVIQYAALGLGHAHDRGVVHRDVKPSNILIKKGDARVVDFGIAAIMDPEGERLTRPGGTPVGNAYAAPELLDSPRMVNQRCDIYSLGACWFWLLTGTTPSSPLKKQYSAEVG